MMKLFEESFGAGTRASRRLHGDRQKYGLASTLLPYPALRPFFSWWENEHCVNPPKGYRVAGRTGGGVGGDGLANFATSIGAFGCTSLSSKFSFPSSHVTVQRNGILTPETSR